ESETVLFANGGSGKDVNRKIEISHESTDHRELLEILFSEDRALRLREVKQFGDDRADSVKVAGPTGTTETRGKSVLGDEDGAVRLIHLAGLRREHGSGTMGTTFFKISVKRSR